jgi:thiol-disulfide isomerase/thioredoxin
MSVLGDAMTECPKCGYRQDGGEECLRCGLVFAKARRPPSLHPVPDPASPRSTLHPRSASSSPPRTGSRTEISSLLTWLLAAVGLMALWLWWSGGSEPAPLLETIEEPRSTAIETRARPFPAVPGPREDRRPGGTDPGFEITPDGGQYPPKEPAPFRQPVVTYQWHEGAEGYRRAIEEQAGTHQPLLVYFYTDWCGYCRQLERVLLTDSEAEDYLRYLIKVKINPEDGSHEKEISRTFGVRGYPSLFAKGYGGGSFVKVWASYRQGSRVHVLSPSEFVETLQRATGYEGG